MKDGYFSVPILDMIPTDPWSGYWVREDWVRELGLELPTTIADWDKMLRMMKDEYGAVMGSNLDKLWSMLTYPTRRGIYAPASKKPQRRGRTRRR